MKFLFSILVLQMAVSSAHAKFSCTVTESDKKSSLTLLPPSEQETYMNEGRFKGLGFSTMQNGLGDSYSVNVTKKSKLLVSATIPFYEDADLKFRHNGNYFLVRCQK
ncbi:MAG: hypothetical protein AABZ31_08970 [Bdellovibrionota bacterium]